MSDAPIRVLVADDVRLEAELCDHGDHVEYRHDHAGDPVDVGGQQTRQADGADDAQRHAAPCICKTLFRDRDQNPPQ